MKKISIWSILYVLSWVIHLSWPTWSYLLVKNLLSVEQMWMQMSIVLGSWFIIVILCYGCPLMYLHEWLALRAGWQKKITYTFKSCFLYKYFISPILAIIARDKKINFN